MKLLLLAGMGEAREMAGHLATVPGLQVLASLSGGRMRGDWPVPLRIGPLASEAALAQLIEDEGIGAVLDATHPYAEGISLRAAAVCAARDLPYCMYLRPPWQPGPGDNWTTIGTPEEAAAHIPERATVFVVTGRKDLPRMANLAGRRVIARQMASPGVPFPIPGGHFVVDKPPFTIEGEEELMRKRGIDVLITRNNGGAGSWPKIEAARNLGLPVLMLARPALRVVPKAQDTGLALDWVRSL